MTPICEIHNCPKKKYKDKSESSGFRWRCLECRREQRRKYYSSNKEEILAKNKTYYDDNKEIILKQIAEREKEYKKNRRRTDPTYKLRLYSSRYILKFLDKQGISCVIYFESIEEDYFNKLKNHLEILFSHPDNLAPDGQIWMNWDNHGKYVAKTWNDDDPSTWTWNLDHIIPISHLPFHSMEDDNFKKAWALSNLRPLSAKQNVKDGNRR